MFVFGDSLIDNGNNNDLPSFAKANYFPYGIDFSGGPTGRFSNGYTIVDTIAQLLGLSLIPPYWEASTDQMKYGAAAGILDITGRNFVSRIPFNQQIKNFKNTLDQINGAANASHDLSKSIFFIGIGNNDYLNNYLLPNYDTRFNYNGQQYADLLGNQYYQQISKLYSLGARKFVVTGLGPLGCIPSNLALSFNGACADDVNQLVVPFNANMKAMINKLSSNLPGVRFSYIDVHNMFQDLLLNPRSYGFSVVDCGCCGIGRNRGQITCLPLQIPCLDRNRYVFWDAFHPTEAVNVLFGKKAFSGYTDVVYPINILHLATL